MEVIIDTNILFKDWMLRTEDARAFLAYIERTGSIIYVPRIVWEETRKNYQHELATKHAEYERASKAFGRSMLTQPELKIVRLDYDQEAEDYLTWLGRKFRFQEFKNVLPYGDFTERIATRALAKRKPFNQQNHNEYKDCLVWETIIDVLAGTLGRGDNEVVLISNDSNAFGAGKATPDKPQERGQRLEKQHGVLHPQLQEETDALAAAKDKAFYYYESFSAFLAAHYTPIQGIDEETVRAYLSQEESGFVQLMQKELNVRAPVIVSMLQNDYRVASLSLGEFTMESTSSIQDFYVYSFQKRKETSASGSIFVDLKVAASYGYRGDQETYTVILRPTAEIKFSLAYVDGQPATLSFEKFILPFGPGMQLPESLKHSFQPQAGNLSLFRERYHSITEKLQKTFLEEPSALSNSLQQFEKFQTHFQRFQTIQESFVNPLRYIDFDSVLLNPPYAGDIWHIQDIREVKPKHLDSPSSKFLPTRGERVPIPKNIPSKRKKKGAKKR